MVSEIYNWYIILILKMLIFKYRYMSTYFEVFEKLGKFFFLTYWANNEILIFNSILFIFSSLLCIHTEINIKLMEESIGLRKKTLVLWLVEVIIMRWIYETYKPKSRKHW